MTQRPDRDGESSTRVASLQIRTRPRPRGRVRLEVCGECDVATAPLLRGAVAAQTRAGRREVQLDLSAVTFLDASGLRGLVEARNDLVCHHAQLVLLRPAPCVVRLLQMTHLDEVMSIRGWPPLVDRSTTHA